MKVKPLVLMLLVSAALAPAIGAQVFWTVFPDPAPLEQPLQLTIKNSTRSSISLPSSAPWTIYDAQNNPVMLPVGLPVIVPVPPLGTKQWIWNQVDSNSKQVPAGKYEARVTYYDSQWVKLTLKTPFEILQITFTVSGNTTPGGQVRLDMHAPTSTGRLYQMACSFGDSPGMPLPVNRLLALNPDALFFLSIFLPSGIFQNVSGLTSKSGYATGYVNLPADKRLIGVTFYAAGATIDGAAPAGIHVHSASKPVKIQ